MESFIITAIFALAALIVISRIRKMLIAFSREEEGDNPCMSCGKSCALRQEKDADLKKGENCGL